MKMEARNTYKYFAKFYDSYTKDFLKDISLYKGFIENCTNILEVGCGTGRILKELAVKNKIITGIDISEEMLEIAKEKLKQEILDKNIIIMEHDFSNGSIEKIYDICLVTWFTFNYIFENADNFLKNIYDCLKEGSLIILDMFYPQTLKHPENNNKWIHKEIKFEDRKYLLKDKRSIINNVEQRIQIFETDDHSEEIMTNRIYYSKTDIQTKLLNAEFNEISFIENYDISTQHILTKNERTENDYICIGKKI